MREIFPMEATHKATRDRDDEYKRMMGIPVWPRQYSTWEEVCGFPSKLMLYCRCYGPRWGGHFARAVRLWTPRQRQRMAKWLAMRMTRVKHDQFQGEKMLAAIQACLAEDSE